MTAEDLLLCYPATYFTHRVAEFEPCTSSQSSKALRERLRRAVLYVADGVSYEASDPLLRAVGGWLALVPSVRRRARYGLLDELSIRGRHQSRCLEVGPGQGTTLKYLKQVGWSAMGLEVDPLAAKSAIRTSGCEVVVGSLSSAALPDNKFDLVYMEHVLEHIAELRTSLSRCIEILRPGGRLVAVYPNPYSLIARAYGRLSCNWDPPRHLTIPTGPAIAALLSQIGFVTVKWKTSAQRARLYGAVADQYWRGYTGNGFENAHPTIRVRLLACVEAILVSIRLPVGEEIIIEATKPGGSHEL